MKEELATTHSEELAKRLMTNGAGQLADRLTLQVYKNDGKEFDRENDLGGLIFKSVVNEIREYLKGIG